MSPKVLNSRAAVDPTREPAVYIGRPSKWGNPHVVGWCALCGDYHERGAALKLYEAHLDASPDLLAALPELRGRDLVCWCAPRPCHGDILLRRANQ